MDSWIMWGTRWADVHCSSQRQAVISACVTADSDSANWPELIEGPNGEIIEGTELESLMDDYESEQCNKQAAREAANPLVAVIQISHPRDEGRWDSVHNVYAAGEKAPEKVEESIQMYRELWEGRVGKDRVRVNRKQAS